MLFNTLSRGWMEIANQSSVPAKPSQGRKKKESERKREREVQEEGGVIRKVIQLHFRRSYSKWFDMALVEHCMAISNIKDGDEDTGFTPLLHGAHSCVQVPTHGVTGHIRTSNFRVLSSITVAGGTKCLYYVSSAHSIMLDQ